MIRLNAAARHSYQVRLVPGQHELSSVPEIPPRVVQENHTVTAHRVFSISASVEEEGLMDDVSSPLISTTENARTQNQQC